MSTYACALLVALLHTQPDAALPVVTISADDTVLTSSCRVVIAPGAIIADANANGVIQIGASNITVEFEDGSILRGSPVGADADTYAGIGIRINGHANVTVQNATVQGYKAGLWATEAPNLTLEGCNASDNFRQRLKSTPDAEDQSDWLYPHRNDNNEHLSNYGAAFYIEDSHHVTVRNCVVRQGQNALILDRVDDSRVYDNDFSFNSGWGIFLYRSSRNNVSRNACDFNIRGYSHEVYNRGQDSAGILLFEQSSNNTIANNSATHCGDGIFAFAGVEALGEEWYRAEEQRLRTESGKQDVAALIKIPPDVARRHKRLGCNDNVFLANDLSYCAAHGLELTFSFGNAIASNLIRSNAICGIWAGYSQDTRISANNFMSNGIAGSRGETGAINIEHGAGNRIYGNKFSLNTVGIRLWDDDDAGLLRLPWSVANHRGSVDNVIRLNIFANDGVGLRVDRTKNTRQSNNAFNGIAQDKHIVKDNQSDVITDLQDIKDSIPTPKVDVLGVTKPFNGRPKTHGRQSIVMTEWGPWDHESPMVRKGRAIGGEAEAGQSFELFGMPTREVAAEVVQGDATAEIRADSVEPRVLVISPTKPGAGVTPFVVRVTSGDFSHEISGTLISAQWDVKIFQTPDYGDGKAPPDLEAFRALAKSPQAKSVMLPRLSLAYANAGPSELKLSDEITGAKLAGDHFGTIATTTIRMAPGRYRFRTTSDDGVRVIADGRTIIENWDWHAPETDAAEFSVEVEKDVTITVEHFEIDGYATLQFQIKAIGANSQSRE